MKLLRRNDIIEMETKYLRELERVENNISTLELQLAEEEDTKAIEHNLAATWDHLSSVRYTLNNISLGKKLFRDYHVLVSSDDLTAALVETTAKRRRESGFELDDFNWETMRRKYQNSHPYVVIEGVTYIPIGEKE